MPERISSVYDIPDWLAEKAPAVTGPVRGLYHAARLPVDVGADLLRRGVHGALGLEEDNPYQYGGERMKKIADASADTAGAISRGAESASRGASSVINALRRALVDAGAKPVEQMPEPQAKSVGSGMDFGPAAAPSPQRGALARNNPTPPDFPRETQDDATKRAGMQLATLEQELRSAGSDDEALAIGKEIATLKKRFPGLVAASTSFDQGVPLQQAATGNTAPTAEEGALPDMLGGMAQANATGALGTDTAAAPAGQARQRLAEMFRQKVAAIEKDSGRKLTEDQRNDLQMDFFLRLMAAGGKKGSNLISNVGAAGLGTGQLRRTLLDTNASEAKDARREAMDAAYREVGFEDKDQDNQRGERSEARADKRADQQYDLLKRRLDEGKWKVQNTDTGLVMLDAESGQTRPVLGADGKPLKLSAKDGTKAAGVQLIEYLEGLDPARRERAIGYLSIGKGKEDDDKIIDITSKLLQNDLTGKLTPEQAAAKARQAVIAARGGGVPVGSKPDPVANKDRVISGPDGRFKSDGKTWVKIQ